MLKLFFRPGLSLMQGLGLRARLWFLFGVVLLPLLVLQVWHSLEPAQGRC